MISNYDGDRADEDWDKWHDKNWDYEDEED